MTQKNKNWVKGTPPKNDSDIRCSGRGSFSCSTSGTCCVTFI